MRKVKKKTLVIVLGILLLLISAWWILTVSIYDENVNQRLYSYEPLKLLVEDFDGLQCTQYKFSSDKGQRLAGYLYSAGSNQRGIIILAHGYGGGHNSYIDCANYFAQNGYYVFAYDATGNDASEGDGVGGFPQGVVDLDYAISFVKESGNFPALPIGLFGHSWGGYSVCSVLAYHPEVKAVIACCGCNRPSDLFEAVGRKTAGDVIYAMMPFVKLHEWFKYGTYATSTAMDGFEKSKAAIMIAHSEDDDVVPVSYGYNLYYEKYKEDPRFTFLHFENKGHSDFFIDGNDTYKDEFDAEAKKWFETLGYDRNADENKERFKKDRAEYINSHLDRARWSHRLDKALFERFLDFYNKNMPQPE